MTKQKRKRKAERLRLNEEFVFVRNEGTTESGRLMRVHKAVAPDEKDRFAIVVSSRFSRKAVERNRARRLLRENYRKMPQRLKNGWIILRPRKYILNSVSQAVEEEMYHLLENIEAE